jgi:predicted dinucleotide-binding enzyme
VVLSNSRGPETLQDLVAELGPLATAATVGQAAEAGDLVVVSIPVKAIGDVPPSRWRQAGPGHRQLTTRSATARSR